MAVISALSPVSLSSYFDPNSGAVLHVDLYFFKGNTLDPLPVYADAALSVLHPIPLPSTGYGRVPPVFIGELPDPGYRVRVFDQYSQLVEDLDNLPGAVAPDGGGGGTGPVQPDDVHLLKTGDYVFAASGAVPREGCVLANGLTLGSATSPATGRANDDAHDLFVKLWGADEYGLLPVLPTRGASAEGDWLANKVITLPDLQCRLLAGMDAMGAPATNRLANVPTADTAFNRPFARGGSALVTLTAGMMPVHAHGVTDPWHAHAVSIPPHGHTFFNGYALPAGVHTHGGTTTVAGEHAHNYSGPTGNSTSPGGGAFVANPLGPNATAAAGAHSHILSIDNAGNHDHTVTGSITNYTGDLVVSNTGPTNISINNTGGGEAHNNTPLIITAAVYLVL